jgi:hypothetical protein
MEYSKKLYANVLLFDDKIINFKTGTTNWEGTKFWASSQPLWIIHEKDFENRLRSEVFSKIVNSNEENNIFFRVISKEFYKMFEIHENYGEDMFKPYYDEE